MEISTARMDSKNVCEANGDYAQESNYASDTEGKRMIYGLKSKINESVKPIYENVKPDLFTGQKVLLRKLFETIEKPDTIYENLCRGCGYGVFEASSYLCNFCSCIVGGLKNNEIHHLKEVNQGYLSTGENIYENVCIKCSALYNTNECEVCAAEEGIKKTNVYEQKTLANDTYIKNKTATKIQKSKSFHKFDKQKLFNGIFGSLKRGVKTKQNVLDAQEQERNKPKQLDIIHHVDGYDNIFRTNETFDLQRICQLKQAHKVFSDVLSSDEHIYGRLKYREHKVSNITKGDKMHISLSKSQELLSACESASMKLINKSSNQSTPSIPNAVTTSRKNSEISNPVRISDNLACIPNDMKLALPLSSSVCYWMKLLRRQIYSYDTHANVDYASCVPKSIPPKSAIMHTYYAAGSSNNDCYMKVFPPYLAEAMTNFPVADKKDKLKYGTCTNKATPENHSSSHIAGEQMESCFDVMVDVFKQTVMSKHMLYSQREFQPSVDHSSMLSVIPTQNHLIQQQTTCINNEYNAGFDRSAEHSPISVMYSPQVFSTVVAEKCLASCCSTSNATEVKNNHCGCLIVVNDVPQLYDSEFQSQMVASIGKYQNTKRKTILKTETIDAYTRNSAAGHGAHEEHVNEFHNNTNLNEVLENKIYIKNKACSKLNLRYLVNCVLISYSLNTEVLHSCSNRWQYFSWLQDWLLFYYNPWSLNVNRALKVLATYNSFHIAFKLWYVLHESVARQKRMLKDDKQQASVSIGEAPISRPNGQVMKYNCIALQCERENVGIFDEKKSKQLIVRKSVGTKSSMKTNDEVILRAKSKESLERNKKAQGKFLDLENSAIGLIEKESKPNDKELELELGCLKILDEDACQVPHAPLVSEVKQSANTKNEHCDQQSEEDIYQSIWKFQTIGEPHEPYDSDPEYYNANSGHTSLLRNQQLKLNDSSTSHILISDSAEDHGEWETDDEFKFSKTSDGCCMADDATSSQTSYSTASQCSNQKTNFDSHVVNLAVSKTANLEHPLLRTVCIFFSTSEPKLRAIVYDYKRTQASQYFSKKPQKHLFIEENRNSLSINHAIDVASTSSKGSTSSSDNVIIPACGRTLSSFKMTSVQAWKISLLNTACAEDEEDLIVSESEILRAQIFKEEPENQTSLPKTGTLQRFKSASFGNLLDIPIEDDKKSITERMRNKLQRGVFKLNMRSPKGEKKENGIFRPVKTGSLYLEGGIQSVFPIFGASLEELEMSQSIHQNVPRFVVDCVSYIERKDCILQDGLYRASGNKVAIDELKKKLSESYIYDSKLLVADDIHTITSLLKQFFRELSKPLIPQHIYDQIGRNVSDVAGIEILRDVLEEIPDPNRATLKFLIRHLKNVAAFSVENRMPASNLAIVWGPCIFSSNQMIFVDIGRMNTLTKLLIENYEYIFRENERLVN